MHGKFLWVDVTQTHSRNKTPWNVCGGTVRWDLVKESRDPFLALPTQQTLNSSKRSPGVRLDFFFFSDSPPERTTSRMHGTHRKSAHINVQILSRAKMGESGWGGAEFKIQPLALSWKFPGADQALSVLCLGPKMCPPPSPLLSPKRTPACVPVHSEATMSTRKNRSLIGESEFFFKPRSAGPQHFRERLQES